MAVQTQQQIQPGIRKIKSFIELGKPKMTFLLTYVALISGTLIYHQGGPEHYDALPRLFLGVLAVALGSAGANFLTSYLDRDIDAVMDRTKHRPIPSGRIAPREALFGGIILVALAVLATLATDKPWSTIWLLFGVINNVWMYSRLSKRRTPWNIVIGAPGGGATAMVGAAAVSGNPFDVTAVLLGMLVVIWTPLHIWSLALKCRDDYQKAGVPMLPVIIPFEKACRYLGAATVLLVVFTAALALLIEMAAICYWFALTAQVVLLGFSIQTLIRPTAARIRRLFKLTSPYLAAMLSVFLLGVVLAA